MNEVSTSALAHIIQLAVAPVFLLAGIGSLLNVLAARLARVVDRARRLESHVPAAEAELKTLELEELAILDRRMNLVHRAIQLCTASALMVCLVVMILFVAHLVRLELSVPVSVLFILAMVALSGGLISFLVEIAIATRTVRVRDEFLMRRGRRRLGLPGDPESR